MLGLGVKVSVTGPRWWGEVLVLVLIVYFLSVNSKWTELSSLLVFFYTTYHQLIGSGEVQVLKRLFCFYVMVHSCVCRYVCVCVCAWEKKDINVIEYKLPVHDVLCLLPLSTLFLPCRYLWFHQQPSSVHVDQSSAVYQQRRSGTTSLSVCFILLSFTVLHSLMSDFFRGVSHCFGLLIYLQLILFGASAKISICNSSTVLNKVTAEIWERLKVS